MNFWRRLGLAYEQDLDERAHEIERQSYREAIAIGLLLALALPLVAPLLGGYAVMRAFWPLLPAATVLVILWIAQLIRVLRGGITGRVALVNLAALLVFLVAIGVASTLIAALIH